MRIIISLDGVSEGDRQQLREFLDFQHWSWIEDDK